MFIYDRWDESLFRYVRMQSAELSAAISQATVNLRNKPLAEEIALGTYMGLHKRVLQEDPNPATFEGDLTKKIMQAVMTHPQWEELRQITVDDRYLSAVTAASIVSNVSAEFARQEVKTPQGWAQATNLRAGDSSRDAAERAAARVGILEELRDGLEPGDEERNALNALLRSARNQARATAQAAASASDAQAAAQAAADDLAEGMRQTVIANALKHAMEEAKQTKETVEALAAAGLAEGSTDAMLDTAPELTDAEADSAEQMIDGGTSMRRQGMNWMAIEAAKHYRGGNGMGADSFVQLGPDALRRMVRSRRYLAKMEGLRSIANEVGRIRAVFRRTMKPTPVAGNPGSIEGVSFGSNPARMTSAGQLLLSRKRPAYRTLFRGLAADGALPEYETWGPDYSGRGPMIIALDESSSMGGRENEWAKSLGLALVSVARDQGRDVRWIGFSNADELYVRDFPKGQGDVNGLYQAATHFYGSGTDYSAWMGAAIASIKSVAAYKKADVILLSDGAPNHPGTDLPYAEGKAGLERYLRAYLGGQVPAFGDLSPYGRAIDLARDLNDQSGPTHHVFQAIEAIYQGRLADVRPAYEKRMEQVRLAMDQLGRSPKGRESEEYKALRWEYNSARGGILDTLEYDRDAAVVAAQALAYMEVQPEGFRELMGGVFPMPGGHRVEDRDALGLTKTGALPPSVQDLMDAANRDSRLSSYLLYAWWNAMRTKLKFRSRGIFIDSSGTPREHVHPRVRQTMDATCDAWAVVSALGTGTQIEEVEAELARHLA